MLDPGLQKRSRERGGSNQAWLPFWHRHQQMREDGRIAGNQRPTMRGAQNITTRRKLRVHANGILHEFREQNMV
jgi:hypothetical protein